MGRASLPAHDGMVFLFPEPTDGRFWMKDTLVPLSVAFWNSSETIVRILDMQPCHADPCPTYSPQALYVGAVEVNVGALDRMGVRVGDRVELIR